MVAIFLVLVAIVALVTSFQSRTLRGISSRSHRGFEAIEVCDSAVNEAAQQLEFQHVFPPSAFADFKKFILLVSDEDRSGLESGYAGYGFQFRDVLDDSPTPRKLGEIFASMTWPSGYEIRFQAPRTAAVAASLPGFKGPLAPVKARPVAWRRDWVGVQWQDWGVVRYQATATFMDGRFPVTRTLFVDRMFSLQADADPADASGRAILLSFIRSARNLKTVIERS
jgi:hypothetical protein